MPGTVSSALHVSLHLGLTTVWGRHCYFCLTNRKTELQKGFLASYFRVRIQTYTVKGAMGDPKSLACNVLLIMITYLNIFELHLKRSITKASFFQERNITAHNHMLCLARRAFLHLLNYFIYFLWLSRILAIHTNEIHPSGTKVCDQWECKVGDSKRQTSKPVLCKVCFRRRHQLQRTDFQKGQSQHIVLTPYYSFF